jgi:hypothetical protein
MRPGEGCLLRLGRERHAVDEVVAVALHVAEAQERDERQILLHARTRQRRQVLG